MFEQDVHEIGPEAYREHVQRGGRALAEVPLSRHLLRELVVVEVVVVLVVIFADLLAVRADALLRSLALAVRLVLETVRLAAVVARLDVRLLVRHRRVLFVALQPEQVVFRVDHAVEQHGRNLGEQRVQVRREVGVLGEGEPELARLERDVLVLVLRRVEHVLRDVVHLGHELLWARGEQQHERLADVPPHDRVLV